MKEPTYDIHERPPLHRWLIFSFQHLFAMVGATVLVPYLTGLDPAVALVTSGIGTLTYILITKGQIPAYLGSSFAFIQPISAAIANVGIDAAMLGAFLAGLVYGIVSLFILSFGTEWLLKLLPPIVVGPVIMVIGLGLAPTAVSNAMNVNGEYSLLHFSVAAVTLLICIIAAMYFKGIFGLVPVLFGMVGGYLYAVAMGIVDFSPVAEAAWFSVPQFSIPFVTYTPTWQWGIAIAMVPVAVVTFAEHTGHQLVLSKVTGRNTLKKPGLHRSIAGDGIAVMISSLLGGPPNTTYGENIGVLAITRVFSVYVIGGAAVIAILFGFSAKVSALISSIPPAVMGGASILLFGIIASSGLRMLIDNRIDFNENRNLVISSVILVIGVGGAMIRIEGFELSGMALATITGIVLNLVLPGRVSAGSMALNQQQSDDDSAA
ncbi:uracil-xanthine permease family protein [Aureibacillus halotolerans]|uniref:Uracil permease n=1 Tax=Aureibacillus halotolerans TaxID=1508390 RepID=A0A4R6UBJ5_9BACI|nr:solute carrier family 23 protein [Aureibacillus halotolerans]TDQ42349.1 uracil permease [Aureibacillus halotolerans]